jgi:hypothetical protein
LAASLEGGSLRAVVLRGSLTLAPQDDGSSRHVVITRHGRDKPGNDVDHLNSRVGQRLRKLELVISPTRGNGPRFY